MSEQTERVSRQSRLQGPFTLGFLHTVLSRVARRYYRTAYWGDHLFSPLIAVVPFTSNDYRKLAEGCFRLAREAKIEADAHAR